MVRIVKSLQLFLVLATALFAETTITGDITGIVFESGGNPFIVEQDILIPAGNKVVIKEGCVFLFKPFTGLTVHGHLLVEGAQEQPVIFTSINDGEFNTASEQLPNPFDWNGILVSRESGTVSINNFHLRFSVYGIKSQNPAIRIDNGLFRQNGQFHFTINDKIQFVQDNIAYSYSETDDTPSDQPQQIDQPKPEKENSKGVKILRFTSLGTGIAGMITGVAFGIQTGIHVAEWNANNKEWDHIKHTNLHKQYITGTVIGSVFGILGFTGFGISFLF